MRMKFSPGLAVSIAVVLLSSKEVALTKDGPEFDFVRDTFAFPNETVFDYHEGIPYAHPLRRAGISQSLIPGVVSS